MKKYASVALAAFLILSGCSFYAHSQESAGPPPVGQTLVREGDFAVKLVDALNIGKAQNEAEAETMLSTSGITPKNGWIANYPVTPDILSELQNSAGDAADAGKLPLNRNAAVKAVEDVAVTFGLPVVAGTDENAPEGGPPSDYAQSYDPSAINNYYYDQGPPVVTYYPPPPDYYYLYAWVPFPFWWSSFWFPGFFVLSDFDRVVIDHGHHKRFTNHYHDSHHRGFGTIDPVRRHEGKNFFVRQDRSREGGFESRAARSSAEKISRDRWNRFEQARINEGAGQKGERRSIASPRGSRMGGQTSNGRQEFTPRSGGTSERQLGRNPGEGAPRGEMRNAPPSSPGRSGGEGRHSSASPMGGARYFSSPSGGERGSFGEGSSGRSFGGGERSFGGDRSGGFGGGSFSSGGGHFGGFGGGGGFSSGGGHSGGGHR